MRAFLGFGFTDGPREYIRALRNLDSQPMMRLMGSRDSISIFLVGVDSRIAPTANRRFARSPSPAARRGRRRASRGPAERPGGPQQWIIREALLGRREIASDASGCSARDIATDTLRIQPSSRW